MSEQRTGEMPLPRTIHCAFCGYGEYVNGEWARALQRRSEHEAQCNRRPPDLPTSTPSNWTVTHVDASSPSEALAELLKKWRAEIAEPSGIDPNDPDQDILRVYAEAYDDAMVACATELEAALASLQEPQ